MKWRKSCNFPKESVSIVASTESLILSTDYILQNIIKLLTCNVCSAKFAWVLNKKKIKEQNY